MRRKGPRAAGLAAAAAFLFALECSPQVNAPADLTAVSPEQRLKDYLEYSRFPDNSRPAGPSTPDFSELRPAKDRSKAAEAVSWGRAYVEGGSLSIPFQVRVTEGGRFAFSTLALKPDGSKFAVLTAEADLSPGRHTLKFTLFGKIITDSGYASPLQLPGIAGERIARDEDVSKALSSGTEPPGGRLPVFAEALVLEGFRPGSFSSTAWDSPLKRQKIRELEAEIKK